MVDGYYTGSEALGRIERATESRLDARALVPLMRTHAVPYEDLGNRLRIPAQSVERMIDIVRNANRQKENPRC